MGVTEIVENRNDDFLLRSTGVDPQHGDLIGKVIFVQVAVDLTAEAVFALILLKQLFTDLLPHLCHAFFSICLLQKQSL